MTKDKLDPGQYFLLSDLAEHDNYIDPFSPEEHIPEDHSFMIEGVKVIIHIIILKTSHLDKWACIFLAEECPCTSSRTSDYKVPWSVSYVEEFIYRNPPRVRNTAYSVYAKYVE